MLGLGSIVGTGVFVSLGVAAGVAGPWVVGAVALGAGVATFNGLSSAQLAANHPVSGGTYEYGYRYLNAPLGFTAGWAFLLAKSASAATAALGFAGYALGALGFETRGALVPLAFAAVVLLTGVVLLGIRRSSLANIVIVSITLLTLALFVVAGFPFAVTGALAPRPLEPPSFDVRSFLYATALMFVAYTGYGRIATLGEEVREPKRTIPRAIIVTLSVTAGLYLAVAVVGVGAVGAEGLGLAAQEGAAPLERAAEAFGFPLVPQIVAFGAITAMLGVLLNLVLGLSRVLLAMGRRGDMPRGFGRLNASGTTPTAAVLAVGLFIALLTLLGDVKTTWSFSAFAVLIYYAITNLAALRLTRQERFFPRWVSAAGLVACLSLAFFVEGRVVGVGVGLVVLGLVWHVLARQFGRSSL